MMKRNDDPPVEYGAFECKVDGVWYAWDEDFNVYIQAPHATREDGYLHIGHYEGDEEGLKAYIRSLV